MDKDWEVEGWLEIRRRDWYTEQLVSLGASEDQSRAMWLMDIPLDVARNIVITHRRYVLDDLDFKSLADDIMDKAGLNHE